MGRPNRRPPRLFGIGSWAEIRRIGDFLREETIGGVLLLAAAATALVWTNSPWSGSYRVLTDHTLGPAALHLDLTVRQWAADGLLAVFFFVAGLELKREFVSGDLRDPRRAAVPVAAAVGGVIVPAVIYLLVNLGAGGGVARGWAIPTATDIAFVLAVLAVVGRHLPSAMRAFLLTLAVVDDLLAIVIIGALYTERLSVLPLLGALGSVGLFAVLVRRRFRPWWLLVPLAMVTWALVHASGVHPTIAGVLLGFAVPVRTPAGPQAGDTGLAEHLEHRWRPFSAGVAVPVFALTSAGVTIGGFGGMAATLSDRVAVGIMAALVFGKPIGIVAATWLVARFTRAHIDRGLAWIDVVGMAMLAGMGFTVSLLIGELAFGSGSPHGEHATIAVFSGSLAAALAASVVLLFRDRTYRRLGNGSNGLVGQADLSAAATADSR